MRWRVRCARNRTMPVRTTSYP